MNDYSDGDERFGYVTAPLYSLLTLIPQMSGFYDFVCRDLHGVGPRDILDVGTGPGTVPARLAASGMFEGIYAVDPSKQMLWIASLETRKFGNVHLAAGSSTRIPFRRKFGLIFSALSFHHWAKQEESLRYLSHFLARNGEIRIYEFNSRRLGLPYKVAVPSHSVDKADVYEIVKRAGMTPASCIEKGQFIRIGVSARHDAKVQSL